MRIVGGPPPAQRASVAVLGHSPAFQRSARPGTGATPGNAPVPDTWAHDALYQPGLVGWRSLRAEDPRVARPSDAFRSCTPPQRAMRFEANGHGDRRGWVEPSSSGTLSQGRACQPHRDSGQSGRSVTGPIRRAGRLSCAGGRLLVPGKHACDQRRRRPPPHRVGSRQRSTRGGAAPRHAGRRQSPRRSIAAAIARDLPERCSATGTATASSRPTATGSGRPVGPLAPS